MGLRGSLAVLATVSLLGSAVAATAATSSVEVVDNAYTPGTVTVAAGDTVTWRQTGVQPHTVTAADGSFDSHPQCGSSGGSCMLQGSTFSHTFPTPGRFDYLCRLHPAMTGVVVVTEAAAPAPPPPPSPTPTPTPTPTATPTPTPPPPPPPAPAPVAPTSAPAPAGTPAPAPSEEPPPATPSPSAAETTAAASPTPQVVTRSEATATPTPSETTALPTATPSLEPVAADDTRRGRGWPWLVALLLTATVVGGVAAVLRQRRHGVGADDTAGGPEGPPAV